MIYLFLILAFCVVLGNSGSRDVFMNIVFGIVWAVVIIFGGIIIGGMGWIPTIIAIVIVFLVAELLRSYRVRSNT
tara:strand:- start:3635 stop:3859 length:225 start_codon:yes stop_codon:yes gene_type:complete